MPKETFRCWDAEDSSEEYAKEVLAWDADCAAWKHAEYLYDLNAWECGGPEGYRPIVIVVGPDGRRRKYQCHYSMTINHFADEIDADPPEAEPTELEYDES